MSESLSKNTGKYGWINEETLTSLILEIDKYVSNLATIFSDIDSKMYDLGNCYQSTSLTALMTKYNEFRKNYEIVKSNVNSYALDLTSLMNQFKSIDKKIAKEIYSSDENNLKKLKNSNIQF